MIADIPAFIAFLREAKRNTYAAAGNGGQTASSRTASHDLHYADGDYAYYDTYLGGIDFAGEEAVWHQGRPIWAMNYYGWMLVEPIPDGFGAFLQAALRAVPAEAPFRGPAQFAQGAFEYHCEWRGDLGRFEGREKIAVGGKAIYELVFHGGVIT